jgi:phosphoribosylformylglycinamidine synthase I
MTPRVAVLQFPGNNSEYETRRALKDAGMEADFFRWNQDPNELNDFDGFVVPGGFSYEDRGRAGLIASMAPVMQGIREQAEQGKPVLGICNGAQIIVETGLVPGGLPKSYGVGSSDKNTSQIPQRPLLLCLARNKRVQDGKLIGVGFYNEEIKLKSMSPKGRTAFTLNYEPNELADSPVAHGEGRFTTSINGLFDQLESNNQIIFKYCDEEGNTEEDGAQFADFPTNPNGAMHNAAAISNVAGNVMAIMPHPERAFKSPMHKIFTSMKLYIEARARGENPLAPTNEQSALLSSDEQKPEPKSYSHKANTIEAAVKLIITDNEAQTIQNTLRLKGFDVSINKWIHFEIEHCNTYSQEGFIKGIIETGELFNSHKETATLTFDTSSQFSKMEDAHYILVRDKEDSEGENKFNKIHSHLARQARQGQTEDDQLDSPNNLAGIHHAWLWEISGPDASRIQEILDTNIFANHHAQDLFVY